MTPGDLADLLDPTIGRWWRELLQGMVQSELASTLSEVERFILSQQLEDAAQALDHTPLRNAIAAMRETLAPVRTAGYDAAAQQLPPALRPDRLVRVSLAQHLVNRPSVEQAIAHADLSRIQSIDAETQEMIRAMLLKGSREGIHPRALAREVRGMIGLTRQQAAAVQRYRGQLVEQGRKPDQIARMVRRMVNRKRQYRAEVIARTEVLRASNEGQRIQWQRLVDDGTLDPAEWQVEWVTAHEERVCPICEPLHGARIDLGGTFVTQVGPLPGPIAHPQCRCTARLVPRGFRQGQAPTAERDRILRGLARAT